ncbi:MAG: hypothetical protein JEZ06_15590 [Anaerolineaceae bacterium]|nr:hypothetical protein [Anaerolineaceae bacterium]
MNSMEKVKEAVDELESLLMKGVQQIRISANEVKPIHTQLTKANVLREFQSREVVFNYILMPVDANKQKTLVPLRIIKDSYFDQDNKTIERPFHPRVKEDLVFYKRMYTKLVSGLAEYAKPKEINE